MSNISKAGKERALMIARASLQAMSDEEDREITADAEADPDNPPADKLFRRRGRPLLDHTKERVTIRLDADVVARLKKEGAGWQTRTNAILRKAVGLD